MRILHVSTELSPIAKLGGVADAVEGLGRALSQLGIECSVVVPSWSLGEGAAGLASTPLARLRVADVDVAPRLARVGPLDVLLVDTPAASGERGWGHDVDDLASARQAALYSRAAVALAARAALDGRPFDVIHAHDWVAAPTLYLARHHRIPSARALTLHSIEYQGLFPRAALDELGLGPEHHHPDALEFYGRVGFLKSGILAADALFAVSPTNAREMLDVRTGQGLDGLLRARSSQLHAILNGIDLARWDPRADPALAAPFAGDALDGKRACKRALLAELGLVGRDDAPLAVFIGRLFEQKGADLLADAIDELAAADVTVVVAGRGDPEIAAAIGARAAANPARARFVGWAPEPLSHRLFAGADVVMVPSRREPCGLVQLYAQRYGAIPVVHRTGGLADTVRDGVTGVAFDDLSSSTLVAAVLRAAALSSTVDGDAMRRRTLALPLGWLRAAMRYREVYASLAR